MKSTDRLIKEMKDAVNLEEQISTIEQAVQAISSLTEEIFKQFDKGPSRYVVAERIGGIRATLNDHLNPDRASDVESRELLTILLYSPESSNVIDSLLDMISSNSEFSMLAARALARGGVKRATDSILANLSRADDKDVIVSLVESLRLLETPIPKSLVEKLSSQDSAWQVRALFDSEVLPE